MSNYHRAKAKGASYFFTVVTKDRRPWFVKERNVNILREAFKTIMKKKPFKIEAIVILPDHLHCLWKMPQNDNDFSSRWREIKKRVSQNLDERINSRGERQVWQRRFWEHQIRDQQDWNNHFDYIHYNPVKHGLAASVKDWKWSSFHKAVINGYYCEDWGRAMPANIKKMEFE